MRSFLLSSFIALGCLNVVLPATAQPAKQAKKVITVTSTPGKGSQDVVINGTYATKGEKGETVYITTDENGLRLKLVSQGTVTIAEDERAISSLSEGGRFEFSRQEKNAPEHKVLLKNVSGKLEANYWIDGKVQDYATAGQAWLATYLPEMISKTGLGAEARAERLYKEGGIQKVLDYTAIMEPGAGRTKMYRHLMAKESLSPADARLLIEQVSKGKTSDYEASSILTKIPGALLSNAETAEAYAKASATLSSDYEKGKTIKHLLKQENLSEKALDKVAEAISTITSDHEKVKVLSTLAARPELSRKQFEVSMQALQNVSSDYERTKGLGAFMHHEQQVVAYFDTVLPLINGISSDYEKAKAYSSLLSNSKLSANQYVPLLKASESISSDYEKSKLLRKMAVHLPKEDKKIKEAYSQAAKTVGSKYEYEKVIAAY
ncbi:hypothetical protein [Rufibacter tibetensis]|uniref:DUF4369 domain-containing protein n=1 Tax=Rufibacter tibetensis TaxID=512763 RepID=A0A0P0CNE2_9BACT|nr:hypothetical protein [Rufibacter tibetensis]ALI98644.1 hypothetical protein DC20_06270 [Rufibacter tibetensis]